MTPRAQLAADAAAIGASAEPVLRICHVMSADLWAGAEIQVATTAAYMVRRPGVSVSAVLFNDGRLANELRRLGVRVTILDEGTTSAFGILRRLTRYLRENRFDLIHTHRYKDSVLGACAAKLAGVPHVVRTVHGMREPMRGWDALKFRIYEALDRLALLCCADLVIAVSGRMAETLRTSGYRPTNVTQIHNGIDLRALVPKRTVDDVRREFGIDPDALVIGTAGRLSPVKGHASLLRAARMILDECPQARFLIVGSGPLKAELVELAARLGIAEACVFTDVRADVHDLMAAMDVFVLSSLHEGLPMALLEAMALSRPVVVTAVGGMPEVIHDEITGVLVTPGDERALAMACVQLARDRTRALALGHRARRFVEERFSHEQNGRALLAAYRSVTLVARTANTRMGERRRELPDRRTTRPPRSEGATLRVVPDAAHRRGVAVSPANPIIRPAGGRRIGPIALCGSFIGLVATRTSRNAEHWRTRQAMRGLRRHPAAVTERLRSARNVLIVCQGNIIRSPFAAQIVRQAVNGSGAIEVASAGLEAVPGNPAHPVALQMAQARRLDLGGHAASPVTTELVSRSDIIFVMEVPQLVAMRRRFPEARERTFLLTSLAPDTPLEIADPVDGSDAVFHACFEHITRATRPLIRTIRSAAIQ
jgi:glycosyltransferase involved in cell wall biosynthesis/protein-tyrosine-phosphatase